VFASVEGYPSGLVSYFVGGEETVGDEEIIAVFCFYHRLGEVEEGLIGRESRVDGNVVAGLGGEGEVFSFVVLDGSIGMDEPLAALTLVGLVDEDVAVGRRGQEPPHLHSVLSIVSDLSRVGSSLHLILT
jgi:hypothetical protein